MLFCFLRTCVCNIIFVIYTHELIVLQKKFSRSVIDGLTLYWKFAGVGNGVGGFGGLGDAGDSIDGWKQTRRK